MSCEYWTPCGCMVTGLASWLRKLTVIVSPTFASISGPGIVAGPSGEAKFGE